MQTPFHLSEDASIAGHRRIPRALLISLILVIGCCLIPATPFLYDSVLYPAWVRVVSPHPTAITSPRPRLLAGMLPMRLYDLQWAADGASLMLFRSGWTSQNMDSGAYARTLDLSTGSMSEETYIPYVSDENPKLARCPTQDLWVATESLPDGHFALLLGRGEETIGTFPIASIQQPPDPYYLLDPEYARFSPDCHYVAVTLSGWFAYESDARDELWLLDVRTRTMKHLLMGRWPAVRFADYPVQSVRPTWSPDSIQLVFGDNEYGMETYNVTSDQRRWLAAPGRSGYGPLWSPTGNWIAVEQYHERVGLTAEYFYAGSCQDVSDVTGRLCSIVMVISPDGRRTATSPPCSYIVAFEWAPTGDQLAYVCAELISHQKSLWLWDLR